MLAACACFPSKSTDDTSHVLTTTISTPAAHSTAALPRAIAQVAEGTPVPDDEQLKTAYTKEEVGSARGFNEHVRKCTCNQYGMSEQELLTSALYMKSDAEGENPHPEWQWPRRFGPASVLSKSSWGGVTEVPLLLKLDGRGTMLRFLEGAADRGCGPGMCGGGAPRIVGQVNLDKTNVHSDICDLRLGFFKVRAYIFLLPC